MVYQKAYNAIIILTVLLLLIGCRKESKEDTVVRWEIINPVTHAPYVNMNLGLIVKTNKGGGPKSGTVWTGETNSAGIAEYTFNAYKNGKFSYVETVNLSSLGSNGFDYAVINRPGPQALKKDEVNVRKYNIIPYADFIIHIKDIDCQNSNDKMRCRSNRLYSEPHNNDWSNWSPHQTATSGYWEGCQEYATEILNSPSDTILYEMEITKNGVTEVVYKKFYVGPEKLDTIKLYY
jgi:hypothetical protein